MFWKFGIWFSCNLIVRLTNLCDPCPISILIAEWVWKDWCQLFRENAVIMTLTHLCLFLRPSKNEGKKRSDVYFLTIACINGILLWKLSDLKVNIFQKPLINYVTHNLIRLFIELQILYLKIGSTEHFVYINFSECQKTPKQFVHTTCS